MTSSVVDTNVLVVANAASEGIGVACQLAAVEVLSAIKSSNSLTLDAGREMLAEYSKHCCHAGQPGVGDEFFRWTVENAALVETVDLTSHEERRFEQFPEDPDLAQFDWDDRVFVAAVLASPSSAQIENAVDSDYAHHAAALEAHGVRVHELCPDMLKSYVR